MTPDGPVPVLRTSRLVLRPVEPADIGSLHALWTSAAVRRFLWDGEVIPPERTATLVASSGQQFRSDGHGLWGAWHEEALAGFGGFWHFRHPPELELLFGVREPDWGRGLATEIGQALLRYGFDVLGLERIRASADTANAASHRVLQKLGFRGRGRRVVDGLETCFFEAWRRPGTPAPDHPPERNVVP